MEKKKKSGINLPHVYIMFMLVMLVVVILSWIIPAGEFERVTDPANPAMQTINPNAFHYLKGVPPIGVMDFFAAMHEGVMAAGNIVVMLLLAVGSLYLLESSGTINAGIGALLRATKGKETLVIIGLTAAFAVFGAIGFGEGAIPFIPLAQVVVVRMGYDKLTGFATSALGLAVGFTSGVLNFYTTGVSQSILGLKLYSGIGFRAIALVIFTVLAAAYIMRYAVKTKKDPSKSLVYEDYQKQLKESEQKNEEIEDIPFTLSKKIAMIGLAVCFGLQAYGAINWKWGMPQMSALYIMFAIFLVIVLRINPNKAAVEFGYGASRLLPAALAIGFASGVMVLMNKAKIIDTVVHHLSTVLKGQPVWITLLILFVFIIIFNFFVVSGSGKALILMPIMGPLASILHINKQIMVLTYQYGDGFTNYFWPTAGALMAALAMCSIEYKDWIKFVWKAMIILHIVGFALILTANSIGI